MPVGRTCETRTYLGSFGRWYETGKNGAALGINTFRPCELLGKSSGSKKFTVGAIQYVEESVSIGLYQQLARLTIVDGVNQHGCFGCVEVVDIVRGKLKMPL